MKWLEEINMGFFQQLWQGEVEIRGEPRKSFGVVAMLFSEYWEYYYE